MRQRMRADAWLARVLAVGALSLAVGAFTAAQTAGAVPPPQLSISLSDGVDTVHSDMGLTYAATVENAGAKAVSGTLAVDVPSYGRYSRTAGGKVRGHQVSWKIRVPAGKTVHKRVEVRLATIAEGQLRVTTLASFYLGRTTGTPIVRTADADRIRGVADPTPSTPAPTSKAAPPHQAASASGHSGLGALGWTLIGCAVVLVLALAVGLWVWRRHRGRAARHSSHHVAPRDQESAAVASSADD